jgi:predicted nuclease of predicted toxin-antitoxin system
MALRYYFDVHVPMAIVTELRKRSVDVLRAQDDGADELDDALLLGRAKELNRVLVSSDKDFLSEVHLRQQESIDFAGVIHYRPARVSFGQVIEDLELTAKLLELQEIQNQLVYLPISKRDKGSL